MKESNILGLHMKKCAVFSMIRMKELHMTY